MDGNLPYVMLRLMTLVTLDTMAGAAIFSNFDERMSIPTAVLGLRQYGHDYPA